MSIDAPSPSLAATLKRTSLKFSLRIQPEQQPVRRVSLRVRIDALIQIILGLILLLQPNRGFELAIWMAELRKCLGAGDVIHDD